jgi:iron(III) transport system substrate-binding protein
LAGSGEVAIGISFENAAQRVIDGGAPVDAVLPTEGLFWEIAGVAIVRGTDNLDAAKRFLDWTTTRRANELFAEDWPIVAISDLSKPLPGIPADLGERLYETDFKWISANRERIVAEWQSRYGVKTEAE